MAQMLGHYGNGACGCRDCAPPGHGSNRQAKRREQRWWQKLIRTGKADEA